MISLKQYLFLLCGLVLTMSASSVCAQVIEINKRPFMDFAMQVKEKVDKKDVNLAAPFSIELSGDLNEKGEFDTQTFRFGKTQGDQQLVNLAKVGVEAIHRSNILKYLSDSGLKTVYLTVSQNEKSFSFVIKSSAVTENTARTDTSSLNLMLSFGKKRIIDEKNQTRADDLLLLNGIRIVSNGKEVVASFEIPTGEFQQLISRVLNKVNRASGND